MALPAGRVRSVHLSVRIASLLPLLATCCLWMGCDGAVSYPAWPFTIIVPGPSAGGPSANPRVLAVFDLDTDGDLDVVVGWAGDGDTHLPTLSLHIQGEGNSWRQFVLDAGDVLEGLAAIAVGTVDADAYPDIIAAVGDHIRYYRAPADPTDTAAWTVSTIDGSTDPAIVEWTEVRMARIVGSGPTDLAATVGDDGRVAVFEGPADPISGLGWTRQDVDTDRRGSSGVVPADVDEDTVMDVVTAATG